MRLTRIYKGDYDDGMTSFIWIIVRTAGGVGLFLGYWLLGDDFELVWGRVLSITVEGVTSFMVWVFGAYILWKLYEDVSDRLPARINLRKRYTLKKLAPEVDRQFEVGRLFASTHYSPMDAAEAVKLYDFRTRLHYLGIPFPDEDPMHLPGWIKWLDFLSDLKPLARDGNLKAARALLAT